MRFPFVDRMTLRIIGLELSSSLLLHSTTVPKVPNVHDRSSSSNTEQL